MLGQNGQSQNGQNEFGDTNFAHYNINIFYIYYYSADFDQPENDFDQNDFDTNDTISKMQNKKYFWKKIRLPQWKDYTFAPSNNKDGFGAPGREK